ncbi:NmrA family protein [Apiospora arundinis]
MSSVVNTVFVCSATGSQGGALARILRSMGWRVHATTRNVSSPAAMSLKDIGVRLWECDWDNIEVLQQAFEGCDKLFLCLLPNWDDPSQERRQCQHILGLAKAAGVGQVVASTTLGVSQLDAGVRHMLNKKAVEQTVIDAGFDHHAFLRPSFFMANFIEPKVARYTEIRDRRTWTTAMTPDTRLPVVDHVDIARFAAAALRDPPAFDGLALGLASDQMRVQEMLDLLAEAAGRPGSLCALFQTDEETETQAKLPGFANSHKVLRTASNFVNLEALREFMPLTSFQEFLDREKEAVERTYK